MGEEYILPIIIKHGSKKSIPLMKSLWREVFGDDQAFIDCFFSNFYRPSRTLLAFEDGRLVSMMYYLDINAKYFKKKMKCAYLYGVATTMSERRRGHFRRLHDTFLEEISAKKDDIAVVLPENEGLYGLYKSFGYTMSLKRFAYKLFTQDLVKVENIEEVWNKKKEIYRDSSSGLHILETLPQFLESRRDHRFFSYGSSYFAFAPKNGSYELYEVISPSGESVPAEIVHYERSALILDITGKLDPEQIEKQKPEFNYLLN